ncbi:GntR family transcriptional regulator [Streptomyces sp. NPDC001941]|uniref:GntR family transcriptional regulator n=1 Tax=Streptomyces sp. NPDC001941 TaxID=3154659 RepID=UPI003321CD22
MTTPPARYQDLADDLVQRVTRRPSTLSPLLRGLDACAIAQHYHVPLPTAQFVRRAALTRLRRRAVRARRSPADDANGGGRGATSPVLCATPSRAPHETVADDLRARIGRGEFQGALPSRLRLSTQYRVSQFIVSRAVNLLAAEGLLLPQGAAGTFVRPATARGARPSAT